MQRFVFRLQKVLDAREALEREAQRRLGEAQNELQQLEAKRDQLVRDIADIKQQGRTLFGGGVTAGAAMHHHRWQRSLEKQLRVQQDACREAERRVERRRAELLEASRDRKVLEQLRDKRREEHEAMLRLEQQAVLDDLGGRRAARQRSSASDLQAGSGS